MTAALQVQQVDYDLALLAPQAQFDSAGGVVFAFQPLAAFLTQLRRLLPAGPRVACYRAEDGDTYVDLLVPSVAWSLWLSDQMSQLTVELLRLTGDYVGLICMIAPETAVNWPEVPNGLE